MSLGVMISYLGDTLASGQAVPQVVSPANPLPVALSGGIGGLSVAGTVADGALAGGQFPVTTGGVDPATGLVHRFNVDGTGALAVNVLSGGGSSVVQQGAGNVANPWTVGGPAASGVAASGNPLLIGAVFNTTLPTFATGQIGDLQLTTRGVLFVCAAGSTGTPTVVVTPAEGFANTSGLAVWAEGAFFNGVTWDRSAKPRTAFRLPSSAATNNAANIKTTAGTIFSISGLVTLAASTCYLKFFDGTGVPNPAAANPLYIFPLNINDGTFTFNLPAGGLYFPTGIGVAIVANAADLDNTAIAAGQISALLVTFF